MADGATTNLDLVKPADHEEAGAELWGLKINADLDVIDGALFSHHFAEDVANHSGLDFAYKSGVVRSGFIITAVVAGTVTLDDDTQNYVEVDPSAGAVSTNNVGFTENHIPLYEVTTASGAITVVADMRAFLGVDWATIAGGVSFYIGDILEVETLAMTVLMLFDLVIEDVILVVDEAPVGADLKIDIHVDGTTIFTTQGNRPTITDGNTSGSSVTPDVTDVEAGQRLTLEIDDIGSTFAGKNLSVLVRGRRSA